MTQLPHSMLIMSNFLKWRFFLKPKIKITGRRRNLRRGVQVRAQDAGGRGCRDRPVQRGAIRTQESPAGERKRGLSDYGCSRNQNFETASAQKYHLSKRNCHRQTGT